MRANRARRRRSAQGSGGRIDHFRPRRRSMCWRSWRWLDGLDESVARRRDGVHDAARAGEALRRGAGRARAVLGPLRPARASRRSRRCVTPAKTRSRSSRDSRSDSAGRSRARWCSGATTKAPAPCSGSRVRATSSATRSEAARSSSTTARSRPPSRGTTAGRPSLPTRSVSAKYIIGGTKDTMRGVSEHVSIGRASRAGKSMDNWFVLCRRD